MATSLGMLPIFEQVNPFPGEDTEEVFGSDYFYQQKDRNSKKETDHKEKMYGKKEIACAFQRIIWVKLCQGNKDWSLEGNSFLLHRIIDNFPRILKR